MVGYPTERQRHDHTASTNDGHETQCKFDTHAKVQAIEREKGDHGFSTRGINDICQHDHGGKQENLPDTLVAAIRILKTTVCYEEQGQTSQQGHYTGCHKWCHALRPGNDQQ